MKQLNKSTIDFFQNDEDNWCVTCDARDRCDSCDATDWGDSDCGNCDFGRECKHIG